MPVREGLRRPFGVFLLVVLLLGLGLLVANHYLEATRRHVVVQLFHVNDSASVRVDCYPVVSADGEDFDLGWLRPDDRVYIAVHNADGGASWGYRLYSNGELKPSDKRGTGPVGYPAERGMVLEKAFTASGDSLGNSGCNGARAVTKAVRHYQRSPDADRVPVIDEKLQHWSAVRFPEDQVHALGEHALFALFVAGMAVALLWPPMRELVGDLPKLVLVGTVTVGALVEIGIGLLFDIGWAGSWLVLQLIGALLLALAVAVALAPHTPSRCPTSSSTRSPNPS